MVERLIAHLGHVEVITPKPEQSAAFFKNVLGLEDLVAPVNRFISAAGVSSFTTRCS